MLARYVLQIVLTWSSTLLPSSSSAFFSTRLLRLSFSKFLKSKLSEKFGNSVSIFLSLNVGKHRAIGECAQVKFWRESFSLVTTATPLSSVLLVKPLFDLSYSNTTLPQSDRDMVAYQVSDLIS